MLFKPPNLLDSEDFADTAYRSKVKKNYLAEHRLVPRIHSNAASSTGSKY
jgi:hypothetical protein